MKRIFNLFRRERLSRDISRELDFHIAERREDLIASGMKPFDADWSARRKFGAYALHREETWMTDIVSWGESLLGDLRCAVRGLRQSPGFAVIAILSLALGIGANTAIFSLIDAVMLRSLPVQHPEQLVQLQQATYNGDYFTNPIWEQIRDRQDIFSGVFAWSDSRFNVADGGQVQYIQGNWVSGTFFQTLGVGQAVGRTLQPSDDQRGCSGAAVLSHSYWTKQYGADPSVVGKTISLEGHAFPIVGVAQSGFSGLIVGQSPDVFIPICSEPVIRGKNASALDRRSWWWLRIMGRPKPGVELPQVKTRLATMAHEVYAATIPPTWTVESQNKYVQRTLLAKSAPGGAAGLPPEMSNALLVLMVAVGLVLLIACANVANLMLARANARQREMAVRLALGAGRVRLMRQMLTESLLLSLAGAALGFVLASWGSQLLIAMVSTSNSTVWLDLTLHTRVLLFTTAVATITGVLFGLLPALRSSRVAPIAAMKAQGRGVTEGRSRVSLGKALVAAQVALSMVLVAGAGLMLTTFRNLATLDPGFRTEGVLLTRIGLSRAKYPKERQAVLWREILTRLRSLPGVQSASASGITPIANNTWNEIIKVENQPVRPGDDCIVWFNAISEGYLTTLGTALVAGRDFEERDKAGSDPVAIINETTAHKFFGNASPLGHVFRVDAGIKGFVHPRTIVGVVRDAKYNDLRQDVPPTAYVPFGQQNDDSVDLWPNFELRTNGLAQTLIPGVKEVVAEMAPSFTVQFTPLAVQVGESIRHERLLATLCSFFGGLALLLAAIGLYGVLSYNVARRRNEIGIRMALGAAKSRVLAMILGEAGWLAFIGLGLGLAATLAATRLVETFLYGVHPDDPLMLAAAAMVLTAVAGLAAYLPARRAALVDPMTALRDE